MADEAVRNTQENWSSGGDSAEVHRVQRADRGFSSRVNKDGAEQWNVQKCLCCGKSGHVKANCWLRKLTCYLCGKKGHVRRACKQSNVTGKSNQTNAIVEKMSPEDNVIFNIGNGKFFKDVVINGKSVSMCFDTASDVSIISEDIFKVLPKASLQPCTKIVNDYSQNRIAILGQARVVVTQGNVTKDLPVLVSKSGSTCIYGRAWIHAFTPNFSVNAISNF